MFRKKTRLSLDCEKSPTKDSNILLNGTSINAVYLVSYRRYMYDMCGSKGVGLLAPGV